MEPKLLRCVYILNTRLPSNSNRRVKYYGTSWKWKTSYRNGYYGVMEIHMKTNSARAVMAIDSFVVDQMGVISSPHRAKTASSSITSIIRFIGLWCGIRLRRYGSGVTTRSWEMEISFSLVMLAKTLHARAREPLSTSSLLIRTAFTRRKSSTVNVTTLLIRWNNSSLPTSSLPLPAIPGQRSPSPSSRISGCTIFSPNVELLTSS